MCGRTYFYIDETESRTEESRWVWPGKNGQTYVCIDSGIAKDGCIHNNLIRPLSGRKKVCVET